jgi:hypothetical protein
MHCLLASLLGLEPRRALPGRMPVNPSQPLINAACAGSANFRVVSSAAGRMPALLWMTQYTRTSTQTYVPHVLLYAYCCMYSACCLCCCSKQSLHICCTRGRACPGVQYATATAATTQHAAAACRCIPRSRYNVQPLQPHLSSSSHTCHRRLPPASCVMPLQMPRQQGGTTAAGGRRRTRLSRALGSSNWEVEFKDITMLKPIGEGAFGRVGCKDSKRNSDRRFNSGEMSGGAVCACGRMPFIAGEGAVRCICLRG